MESIGITEDSVGAPIRATMDTEQIGTFDLGRSIPVHMDTYAHNADGIILINRVKSHPSFRARYESGLMKMMAIGLGKQFGAQNYHQLGYGSFPGIIEAAGRLVLREHTTGLPHCIASITGRPKPSHSEGKSSAWQWA